MLYKNVMMYLLYRESRTAGKWRKHWISE